MSNAVRDLDVRRSGWQRAASLMIRWVAPIGILALFVATGHLGAALHTLADASPAWVVPLVLAGVALPVTHAWRWVRLVARTGGAIGVAGATAVTALASLINYAAPGFLGAPAKAVLARNGYGLPISRSLPTLAVEQLLDAALLAVAGALAVVLVGPVIISTLDVGSFAGNALLLLGLLVFAMAIALLALIIVRKFLPGFAASVSDSTTRLLRSGDGSRSILALTGARWVLDMSAVWLASMAIGLRLSLLEVLLIANLSLLAGMLAPVPGGLGVREGVMAVLAGAIGVSIPAILALSVLHRAGLGVGLPIVLGLARGYEWSRR